MLFVQGAEILHGGNRSGHFFKLDHSHILLLDRLKKLHDSCIMLLLLIGSFYLLSYSLIVSAPEAQRETVFVCAACNSSLIKLQWDGIPSLLSPSGQQEVIHCLPPSPAPSYPGFQVKALLSTYFPCCTPRTHPPPMPYSATLVANGTSTVIC